MTIEQANELKERAVWHLVDRIDDYKERLLDIDARIWQYVEGVARDYEYHNLYEVLGVVRFLRYIDTYYMDIALVRRVYKSIEGAWECNDGVWSHVQGGFTLTSIRGRKHYRLSPMQCYVYASIYGFHYYFDKGEYDGVSELLSSECLSSENHVLDYRRVITEADIFIPRKNGKSDLASNFCVLDMMGVTTDEPDGQALLCANSRNQSEVVYKMAREKVQQLDPEGKHIRVTASQINWKPFHILQGEILAQTSGGKTKDGLKASIVVADEFGSAYYVKERSDMVDLVNVCRSSMGTRRQPLFIATTTAGLVVGGPYEKRLEGIFKNLTSEI